ncbi:MULTISPECIES: RDD family protein [unclassified Nocardioides]|uniref:RDD family protein n=1 Tax=unclassified Nocardioides TaxID=2615069 RepID=UPI00361D9FEC
MNEVLAPAAPAADLDRRFYAFAIDRAIAWGIDAAAAVVIVQLLGPDRVWVAVAAILGVVLFVGGAFAVVLGRTGATPGNAVAAIRVVGEGSGTPIGVPAALLRQLVLGVAALPTLGLGVATLAWTAAMDPTGRRRGWHDHLVGSVVVDVRPVPEEEPEPETGPRHVVNLTALRLVPAPPTVATPAVPRPASPPPAGPPAPRHAAVEQTTGTLSTAPARQQLGYPLVPEPRPDARPEPAAAPAGGAHAARPATGPVVRWRIGFDTGESFVVEGLVLVGRRPEQREGERVRHVVPLPSDDMSLSKTHAQLQVAADGALVVMDRGSTNGSILIRQGVPRGLPSGKAATLVDGDRVRFGDREMSVVRES